MALDGLVLLTVTDGNARPLGQKSWDLAQVSERATERAEQGATKAAHGNVLQGCRAAFRISEYWIASCDQPAWRASTNIPETMNKPEDTAEGLDIRQHLPCCAAT